MLSGSQAAEPRWGQASHLASLTASRLGPFPQAALLIILFIRTQY